MQDAFTDVKFIRDDLHQLQAVTAYCVRAGMNARRSSLTWPGE